MSKRTSAEQFDQQASHYNAQWNKWSEASLNWLLDHAECGAQDRVLDVATGTGFTALAFAARVKEVIGSGRIGRYARPGSRQCTSGRLGQCDVRKRRGRVTSVSGRELRQGHVPRRSASFLISGTILCRSVSGAETRWKAIDRRHWGSRRISEVDEWQNQVEALRDTSHVRNYSLSEWRKLADTTGFQVEESAELEEEAQMGLEDWMKKSGCVGEAAARCVRCLRRLPRKPSGCFISRQSPTAMSAFDGCVWCYLPRKTRKVHNSNVIP